MNDHNLYPLTDEQCDEFRRLPLSFNDMVRAIYQAGIEAEREACAAICDDLHGKWHWGDDDPVRGPSECAAAIRERSNT